MTGNKTFFKRGTHRHGRGGWDGRADDGTLAASGVYYVRIATRLGAESARAVLVR